MARFRFHFAAVLLTLMMGGQAHGAEINTLVIIVNASSGITELTRSELINLYMGRINRLPTGVSALPLDLDEASEEFYSTLVDKRPAEINAYWARLLFSGRASPPRKVATTVDMLQIVADNPGAIGYVRSTDVDDRVHVLMEVLPRTRDP